MCTRSQPSPTSYFSSISPEVFESIADQLEQDRNWRRRCQTLARASCVSKSWREPCQRRLYAELRISSMETDESHEAVNIAQSEALTRYPRKSLEFFDMSYDWEYAEVIIERSVGVTSLELGYDCFETPLGLLVKPALKELKSLTLLCDFEFTSSDVTSPVSFNLEHLEFNADTSQISIVKGVMQTRLIILNRLSLRNIIDTLALTSLAPILETLSELDLVSFIVNWGSLEDHYDSVSQAIGFLALVPSLTHLRVNISPASYSKAIPPCLKALLQAVASHPLRSFKLTLTKDLKNYSEILTTLTEEMSVLKGFESLLNFMFIGARNPLMGVTDTEGWKNMLQGEELRKFTAVLEKKDVKLTVQERT